MPFVIASDDKFRIVKLEDGDRVTYVIEKQDGCDALGVERWRDVSSDSPIVRALRDWIIRAALKEKINGDSSDGR